MEYAVKLDRFEGPYTKLLDLIETRKLSITEIDLAQLADDYIHHTKTLEKKDHFDMSLFIVVASTLMLMKVKSLLPKVDYTDAEEKQVHDLTHRLELLSLVNSTSKKLGSMFSHKKFFSYSKERLLKKELCLPKNLTLDTISQARVLLIEDHVKLSLLHKVRVPRKTQLEDVLSFVRNHESKRLTLREIQKNVDDSDALVLSFLSILELIRLGEINAWQEKTDDISIEKTVLMLQ